MSKNLALLDLKKNKGRNTMKSKTVGEILYDFFFYSRFTFKKPKVEKNDVRD